MGTGTAMVMRIVTKFTHIDAFVASFSRYCTPTSCFVPSVHAKALGGETGFSIRLADQTELLRGTCTVLASWADDVNPFGRPGVQLGIHSITPATRPLFERLCRVIDDDEFAPPTVEMPMQFPPAEVTDEPDTAVPEEIDGPDSALNSRTAPIAAPATLLALVAGRPTDKAEPLERPPVMTLLGVAPITQPKRLSAPRVAMPALSPTAEPPSAPAPLVLHRRSMWDRVFGRLSALLRKIRWAFRRRRGVRAALRRLPTRT